MLVSGRRGGRPTTGLTCCSLQNTSRATQAQADFIFTRERGRYRRARQAAAASASARKVSDLRQLWAAPHAGQLSIATMNGIRAKLSPSHWVSVVTTRPVSGHRVAMRLLIRLSGLQRRRSMTIILPPSAEDAATTLLADVLPTVARRLVEHSKSIHDVVKPNRLAARPRVT
jgi:hypothetical protein